MKVSSLNGIFCANLFMNRDFKHVSESDSSFTDTEDPCATGFSKEGSAEILSPFLEPANCVPTFEKKKTEEDTHEERQGPNSENIAQHETSKPSIADHQDSNIRENPECDKTIASITHASHDSHAPVDEIAKIQECNDEATEGEIRTLQHIYATLLQRELDSTPAILTEKKTVQYELEITLREAEHGLEILKSQCDDKTISHAMVQLMYALLIIEVLASYHENEAYICNDDRLWRILMALLSLRQHTWVVQNTVYLVGYLYREHAIYQKRVDEEPNIQLVLGQLLDPRDVIPLDRKSLSDVVHFFCPRLEFVFNVIRKPCNARFIDVKLMQDVIHFWNWAEDFDDSLSSKCTTFRKINEYFTHRLKMGSATLTWNKYMAQYRLPKWNFSSRDSLRVVKEAASDNPPCDTLAMAFFLAQCRFKQLLCCRVDNDVIHRCMRVLLETQVTLHEGRVTGDMTSEATSAPHTAYTFNDDVLPYIFRLLAQCIVPAREVFIDDAGLFCFRVLCKATDPSLLAPVVIQDALEILKLFYRDLRNLLLLLDVPYFLCDFIASCHMYAHPWAVQIVYNCCVILAYLYPFMKTPLSRESQEALVYQPRRHKRFVPIFVSLIKESTRHQQCILGLHACAVICNVTYGNRQYKLHFGAVGACEAIVQLLRGSLSSRTIAKDQEIVYALHTLENLASCSINTTRFVFHRLPYVYNLYLLKLNASTEWSVVRCYWKTLVQLTLNPLHIEAFSVCSLSLFKSLTVKEVDSALTTAEIVGWGLDALSQLTRSRFAVDQLNQRNAVETIVLLVMKLHPTGVVLNKALSVIDHLRNGYSATSCHLVEYAVKLCDCIIKYTIDHVKNLPLEHKCAEHRNEEAQTTQYIFSLQFKSLLLLSNCVFTPQQARLCASSGYIVRLLHLLHMNTTSPSLSAALCSMLMKLFLMFEKPLQESSLLSNEIANPSTTVKCARVFTELNLNTQDIDELILLLSRQLTQTPFLDSVEFLKPSFGMLSYIAHTGSTKVFYKGCIPHAGDTHSASIVDTASEKQNILSQHPTPDNRDQERDETVPTSRFIKLIHTTWKHHDDPLVYEQTLLLLNYLIRHATDPAQVDSLKDVTFLQTFRQKIHENDEFLDAAKETYHAYTQLFEINAPHSDRGVHRRIPSLPRSHAGWTSILLNKSHEGLSPLIRRALLKGGKSSILLMGHPAKQYTQFTYFFWKPSEHFTTFKCMVARTRLSKRWTYFFMRHCSSIQTGYPPEIDHTFSWPSNQVLTIRFFASDENQNASYFTLNLHSPKRCDHVRRLLLLWRTVAHYDF